MALLHLPSAAAAPPQAPPHMRRGASAPRVALDQARSAPPSLDPPHTSPHELASRRWLPNPQTATTPLASLAPPTQRASALGAPPLHAHVSHDVPMYPMYPVYPVYPVYRACRLVRASLLTSSRRVDRREDAPTSAALSVVQTPFPWCRRLRPPQLDTHPPFRHQAQPRLSPNPGSAATPAPALTRPYTSSPCPYLTLRAPSPGRRTGQGAHVRRGVPRALRRRRRGATLAARTS